MQITTTTINLSIEEAERLVKILNSASYALNPVVRQGNPVEQKKANNLKQVLDRKAKEFKDAVVATQPIEVDEDDVEEL